MNKKTLLNTSFALIWLDFPLIYFASVSLRDPALTAVALAVLVLAVVAALLT